MSHSVLIKAIFAALLVCSSTAAAASTPSSQNGEARSIRSFGSVAPEAHTTVYHRRARAAAAPAPSRANATQPASRPQVDNTPMSLAECNRRCKADAAGTVCTDLAAANVLNKDPNYPERVYYCTCQKGYVYAEWMMNPETVNSDGDFIAPIPCAPKGAKATVAQCTAFCQANEAGANSECGIPADLSCVCSEGYKWSEPDSDTTSLCIPPKTLGATGKV